MLRSVGLACAALAMALGGSTLVWAAQPPSAEIIGEANGRAPHQVFGSGRNGIPYVSESTCLSCHPDAGKAWAGSHHALAMQEATPDSVLGDFSDLTYSEDKESFRFFKKNGSFYVNAISEDGSRRDYPILYTFGVDPLQQYLVPGQKGRLQVLGAAWDTKQKRWFDVDPGSSPVPGDAFHWTGRYQSWNAMCADCHSTGLMKAYDSEADAYTTTWSVMNVGCQACHGPGGEHVAWAESPSSPDDQKHKDYALVNRHGLSTARGEVDTCAPCHSRRASLTDEVATGPSFLDDYQPQILEAGLYHADGQILDEVYVYGSFLQSRMYQAGVRCSDCHEPHGLGLRASGNALCVRCHSETPERELPGLRSAAYDTKTHHHHEPGTEGAQCVSCHMPATNYMVVDPRRDHGMHVPRPDLTVSTGAPNACNGCHADRSPSWAVTQVRSWYGPTREHGSNWAETIAGARSADPAVRARLEALSRSESTPDIVRATAVALLPTLGLVDSENAMVALADDDALVRLQGVRGLAQAPGPERLRLLVPRLNDPVRSVRMEAGRGLADVPPGLLSPVQSQLLEQAVSDYERAQRAQADLPPGRVNLALLYSAQGRMDRAIFEYRQAIDQDPAFVPPVANLAGLLDGLGRSEAAEEVLRSGLEHNPNSGELHYSLGLLLAGQARLVESVPELEAAARLLPGHARASYNLGLALQHLGQRDRALSALRQAAKADPGASDFPRALAIFYLQDRQWKAARAEVLKWLSLSPNDVQARSLLVRIERDRRESEQRAR